MIAGQKYAVDPLLLYSIAKIESNFNILALNRNRNGSYDIGIMQINTAWIPTLKVKGINPQNIFWPCFNILLGAWILAKAIRMQGNNWRAVGAYNAGNLKGIIHEKNRIKYAKKIFNYYTATRMQLSTSEKRPPGNRVTNDHGSRTRSL